MKDLFSDTPLVPLQQPIQPEQNVPKQTASPEPIKETPLPDTQKIVHGQPQFLDNEDTIKFHSKKYDKEFFLYIGDKTKPDIDYKKVFTQFEIIALKHMSETTRERVIESKFIFGGEIITPLSIFSKAIFIVSKKLEGKQELKISDIDKETLEQLEFEIDKEWSNKDFNEQKFTKLNIEWTAIWLKIAKLST